ncbi:hypothetical protein ACT3R8_11750 [Halomonas sp. AOP42-C2-23]|uniref:hypothetical protein n=1 Tax=Halomonas sp. AOP42-C2-23 TaxID=3457669 RepID=UPI0040338944
MRNDFVQRPVVILDANDANVEVIQPQFAVLMQRNTSKPGRRYLDVGSFCYQRRDKSCSREVGTPVDLSSLDIARIPFVQATIEEFRRRKTASWLGLFASSKAFVDWIDAQKQPYAFDDVGAMRNAYCDYTRHLLHRMNTSSISGQRLKQATASHYQTAARILVMLAAGLSEREVKGIATTIPRKRTHATHVNVKLPSADVQAQTFAALINFIDESHRLLVGSGALPLHLVSPNGESSYLYSMEVWSERSKAAKFSLASLLLQSPVFPTWDEVKSHFGLVGDSKVLRIERAIYDSANKRCKKNNKDLRSDLRRRVGTYAVIAGMLAFIAATGCNLSVAKNLKVDTLQIVPSTQGQRFSGTKARAAGKTVIPEFGAQFVSVFKKYLELRKWVLNGSDSTLVFPNISPRYGISPASQDSIRGFKTIFSKTLPKTVWITPTHWRKNVSYQYVKLSGGDMALTAEKLSNTEDTVRQAYSRPALEDFAGEMAGFFEAMLQAAIDRTRSVERIPVRILDDKRPEIVTGTGLCEKTPETLPERAQGFTDLAPTPSCRDPETCLFCSFYAVHADEEDIRRLLSLLYLIQATKNKQPIDHWQSKYGPTIHRIEEVLSAVQEADASSEVTINRVREEVESGDLDTFWSIHFDTLVTLGAVS